MEHIGQDIVNSDLAIPVARAYDSLPGRFGCPTTLKCSLCPFTPAKSAISDLLIKTFHSMYILIMYDIIYYANCTAYT